MRFDGKEEIVFRPLNSNITESFYETDTFSNSKRSTFLMQDFKHSIREIMHLRVDQWKSASQVKLNMLESNYVFRKIKGLMATG